MIRIKNWEKFQHYKHRNPPWIKLHCDLLDDPDWFRLKPEDCKFLTFLWMVASKDKMQKGYLPDINVLAFRYRVASSVIAELLNHLKEWLIDDASNMLATCKQDASSETETETETEGEGETEDKLTPLQKAVDDWTLEDCRKAALTIGMSESDITAFWSNYASVGWVDAAGRKIVHLSAALAKWKARQPSFGKKYSEQLNTSKDPKRVPSKSEQRNEAVRTTVDRLEQYAGTDEYARQMSAARDKYRDMGKNEAGQTVLDEALEIVRFRKQLAEKR